MEAAVQLRQVVVDAGVVKVLNYYLGFYWQPLYLPLVCGLPRLIAIAIWAAEATAPLAPLQLNNFKYASQVQCGRAHQLFLKVMS